ncbi:clostripain [Bacteroidia bacterium]|nr:clostripain [Bacteroidia bacterium]
MNEMQIKSFFFFLLIITFFSCEKDSETPPAPAERTVIVYMAADNNLANDALRNIRQMQRGYTEAGVHLVVFVDTDKDTPLLLKIRENGCDTVKTFPEMNTANPQTLNAVLQECVKRYPAHSYGLVLWSHASSWLPVGARVQSFGKDNEAEMNIPDLSAALPVHFDFIVFDACLMGSVEALYELRGKTDYVIASSAETIADGFPYAEIVPDLLQNNLQKIAETYFDFYNQKTNAERSATIALIDVRELEALAAETKKLFIENLPATINRTDVQRLNAGGEAYQFDLLDFINKTFPNAYKENFTAQLNKTVLYKAHTPQLLGMYDINTHCGLACYIPIDEQQNLNNYYKTLQWYNDAGIFRLF